MELIAHCPELMILAVKEAYAIIASCTGVYRCPVTPEGIDLYCTLIADASSV